MIGLRRGTVKLVEYREEWPVIAQETIALLQSVLGDTAADIQHVGSTAVPGMSAKPIIDLVVGVRGLEQIAPYADALREKGIVFVGSDVPRQLLFVMDDAEYRTHHIHIVLWNGHAYKDYIRFRDYLRAFKDKAALYEARKRELAELYPQDRAAYTRAKAETVSALLSEANHWTEGSKRVRAILICGRIAGGKTIYARRICREENAVLLSVDEITLEVLGGNLGDRHDEIAERTQQYLLKKSLEILQTGTTVVLDWGFWTAYKRRQARAFYESRGIACEFHYLDTPQDVLSRNIAQRNKEVLAGKTSAYLVDEGLLAKLEAVFEPPRRDEIDVWNDGVR